MTKRSLHHLPAFRHSRRAAALMAFFFLGHILGILTSGSAEDFFRSAMRTAASSPVSLGGLLTALVLPFLFSAFAVYVKQPMLLIPIAFWKAFLFSCLACGLFRVWGRAGWLITGLVISGRILAMPPLCWYWLHHIRGRRFEPGIFWLILSCLIAIGVAEYLLIVPFLGTIITF